MSSPLAAGKVLEQLEQLKAAAAEFGARAEKLRNDFRLRSGRERHRQEAALGEQTQQVAATLAEAEAFYQKTKAATEKHYEQRKVRIGKAYQSSRELALKRVEDQIGGLKYELQKRILQAEKDRESHLAKAVTSIEEFRRQLAGEQESLARMEGRTQACFKGYRGLLGRFFNAYEKAQAVASQDEHQLLQELRELLGKADGELNRLRNNWLLRIFKFWPLWLVLMLGALGLVPVLQQAGIRSFSYREGALVAAGGFVLVLALRYLALRQATPLADSLSQTLAQARKRYEASHELAEAHHQQTLERVKTDYITITQTADQKLKQTLSEAGQKRIACRVASDEKMLRVTKKHEQLSRTQLARREREYQEVLATLQKAAEVRKEALGQTQHAQLGVLNAGQETEWRTLETEWKNRVAPLLAALTEAKEAAERLFPPWQQLLAQKWTPPAQFGQAAQFGQLQVDLEQLCEILTKETRLALPEPARFAQPLCLAYPEQGSLLFETTTSGQEQVIGALNNILLRLLSVAPPGRIQFTILDPVGLGQNFAGVMHLADYEEQLINNKIWTQSGQIEQQLADLNEHMEKVIQMYLRNEYQSIAEYNEQAGVIAEKYHVLVVADFPANFTDVAAKRLLSIAASGARCGVYTLIHWDHRQPLPDGFIPDELRKSSLGITCKGNSFVFTGQALPGTELVLEAPPAPEPATQFIHEVGRCSRDSSRVEVPFEQVTPPDAELWREETTSELRVPIGRTGATKLQYLALGRGTCQHGLIAGKTGSGKSTLFHVIITNLALWCSPEQVEFYLVDFKKGVEFKCYGAKRLPHARVVAIESDREFGLSVLQRVDDELRRRGDLFRQLGVQDIPGYKRAGGTEPMPRTLLLIDEFQEFFVEDDKIAQTASLLLDRIVRQGRAFGIHVILGSQTLGGAYTVARTTLGQMVVRIALQCNEADAYLIMDDNNPAPRLLSRPGEGLYNDMAGAIEGNSPFQTVWLPEEVRDAALTKVREQADRNGKPYAGPIVFEGNAPAEVRENAPLRQLLEAPAGTLSLAPSDGERAGVRGRPPGPARFWLGAPNSIKGPTEAVFQRQSGNHLLMIGQREEATLAMLSVGLVALAAQYPVGGVRIILCDTTAPGNPHRDYLEHLVQGLAHPITLAKPGDLGRIMKELAEEMKARSDSVEAETAPPVFLIVHDLQRFSKLRYEEDFGFSSGDAETEPNPGAVFNTLICEGARLGLHVIATCDTYNNVVRFLSRKALSEFEMRLLFQMSANDSASLIDSPKASTLGLHRALFYNAQEGYLETFRPYALPNREWVEQACADLGRLTGKLP